MALSCISGPILGLAFVFSVVVMAQDSSTSSSSSSTSAAPSSVDTSIASTTTDDRPSPLSSVLSSTQHPPYNDTAPGGNDGSDGDDHHSNDNNDNLINYYFIFLALILCFVGLIAFFILKRRRRAMLHSTFSRQNALARDINGWGDHSGTAPTRGGRRYWPGNRWRSQEDLGREEGLNEHGEAPPPYVPKRDEEGGDSQAPGDNGPAIPLQALNRGQVTMSKPPEYTQTEVRLGSMASSVGEPSSSRTPEETPRDSDTPTSNQPHH